MSFEGWIYVLMGRVVTRFKIPLSTTRRCDSCGKQACVLEEIWYLMTNAWCETCWQEIRVDCYLTPDEIKGVSGKWKIKGLL